MRAMALLLIAVALVGCSAGGEGEPEARQTSSAPAGAPLADICPEVQESLSDLMESLRPTEADYVDFADEVSDLVAGADQGAWPALRQLEASAKWAAENAEGEDATSRQSRDELSDSVLALSGECRKVGAQPVGPF